MGCLGLLIKNEEFKILFFDTWMIICDAPLLSENMNLVIKYCNEFFGS